MTALASPPRRRPPRRPPSALDPLNRALAARYRAGDRDAGAELCRLNAGLVVRYARHVVSAWRLPEYALADLVQCGKVGVLDAAAAFDPGHLVDGRRVAFITFASHHVRNRVRLGAGRETLIRVPARARLATATPEHRELASRASSLRALGTLGADADSDDDAILGLAAPDESEAAGDADERAAESAALAAALGTLDDRCRAVIVRRYGLDGAAPETLREVGARLGMCPERVRQLQASTLVRLRLAMKGRGAGIGGDEG